MDNSATPEINIVSSRGCYKFSYEGFLYLFDRHSADRVTKFWRCERRNTCNARIHERDGRIIQIMNTHTHSPNPYRVEAMKAVTKMKARASISKESSIAVWSAEVREVSEVSRSAMPSAANLQRTIRRERQRLRALTDPSSLVFADSYTKYCPFKGLTEQFLLFDSGPTENRILVFGRPRAVGLLNCANGWYGNGTLNFVPNMFEQFYVISGLSYGTVHPLLFILLSNKKKESYEVLFRRLREMGVRDRELTFSCGFEIDLIDEFRKEFPSVTIGGRLSNFSKEVLEQVRRLGFATAYKNDCEFNFNVRIVIALAFVPPNHVARAFDNLKVYFAGRRELRLGGLFEYLEKNFIGRRLENGRDKPTFDINWWNLYSCTLEHDPRINMYAESRNKKLHVEFNCGNPSIWTFVTTVKRVQKMGDAEYTQALTGCPSTAEKREYELMNEALFNSVIRYGEEKTILDYLRAIAHNFTIRV